MKFSSAKCCGWIKGKRAAFEGQEDTWCLQGKLNNGAAGHYRHNGMSIIKKGWACGTNGYIEFDISTGKYTRDFLRRELKRKLAMGIYGRY